MLPGIGLNAGILLKDLQGYFYQSNCVPSVYPTFSFRHKKSLSLRIGLYLIGSLTWARTRDKRINSPSLYQLSYQGIARDYIHLCILSQSILCFLRPKKLNFLDYSIALFSASPNSEQDSKVASSMSLSRS